MSEDSASVVPEDSSQHQFDEDPRPFYSLDLPFPRAYHRQTKLVGMISQFQTFYESAAQGSTESSVQNKKPRDQSALQEPISLAEIIEAFENNGQFAQDPLIMDIIGWLGRGDYHSVLLLAKAFEGLELGFPELDGERNRAKFCAMVACDELQYVGFSRSQVTKSQIRDRADQIRALFELKKQREFRVSKERKRWRRGFKWSAQALEAQIKVGQLTKADWTQVWKGLGLADIEGNPGAQKQAAE